MQTEANRCNCVEENFKYYFAVLFLQPNHITCIPNMFIYYLSGFGNFFFHIAHYEKFSLRVKFRFIQMYSLYSCIKKIQLNITSDTRPWRIHTDLLAICALCSRHVTVMHGIGLSRVPTEPETLLVRLTKAPEVDQSSGRPHD